MNTNILFIINSQKLFKTHQNIVFNSNKKTLMSHKQKGRRPILTNLKALSIFESDRRRAIYSFSCLVTNQAGAGGYLLTDKGNTKFKAPDKDRFTANR